MGSERFLGVGKLFSELVHAKGAGPMLKIVVFRRKWSRGSVTATLINYVLFQYFNSSRRGLAAALLPLWKQLSYQIDNDVNSVDSAENQGH